MANRTCSLDECERTHHARGLCYGHWRRQREHGDPRAGKPLTNYPLRRQVSHREPKRTDGDELRERILSRVAIMGRGHSTPCWISDRASNGSGYTKIQVDCRTLLTHRLAYELFVGPIPDGLDLDHLCRVPPCCNPDHLEPVTNWENQLRGNTICAIAARHTHCPQGHEFTAANTYFTPSASRQCRTCRAETQRRHTAARRARLVNLKS